MNDRPPNRPPKKKFHRGRLEIPLQRKGEEGKEMYFGEWGDAHLMLDLSAVKFLLFPSRDTKGNYTLIIDDKKTPNGND